MYLIILEQYAAVILKVRHMNLFKDATEKKMHRQQTETPRELKPTQSAPKTGPCCLWVTDAVCTLLFILLKNLGGLNSYWVMLSVLFILQREACLVVYMYVLG